MANLLKNIDFTNSDPLLDSLQLINEVESTSSDDFPISVFPHSVQHIITEAHKALKYPKCYLSGGMLFAASVAIGNSHKLIVRHGWKESALIYLINVGAPGANKTHPTKFALDPLFQLDAETYKTYKARRKDFEEASSMSRKERQDQGVPDPVRPIWEKYLVSDSTPEGLVKIHEYNKRSIGLYADEALAWISNFNRYSKGSEGQFWLSNWSQTPVIIDRKGDDSILIQNPFISVVGSIQPSMLSELARENRGNNGFLDRLLFVYPENVKKEYWTEDELNPQLSQTWASVLRRITSLTYPTDINGNHKSNEVTFSLEARALLNEWQRTNTDLCNEQEERSASIYSKMEIYVCRFALILQLLKWGCEEGEKDIVSAETVKNAIELTEYFRTTALRVHSTLNESPSENLPELQKTVFNALPDSFLTREGLAIASRNGMPDRTFMTFLKNKSLFRKLKHAEYEKCK
jgi:hypothetical protein